MLKVKDLSVCRKGRKIIDGINFSLSEKSWLMIAGPNGAGKTTVINALAQNLKYSGGIFFEEEDAASFSPRQTARFIGVLSQNCHANYSFTVSEIVRLGRYSHSKGIFKTPGRDDEEKIKAAINDAGIYHLRDRSVLSLSGGELRRAFLAQVLAQDPKIIVLDEPTNDLDLKHQKQVFELICKWIQDNSRCAVSAIHDLNSARSFGSHALLLNKGAQISFGTVRDALTEENLNNVYQMNVPAWINFLHSHW